MNLNLDGLILDDATMSTHQVSLLPFDAQSSIPDRPNNLLRSHSSFAAFLLTHAQRCLNHQTISVATHQRDKSSRELPAAELMEPLCWCVWLDVQPARISEDIQKAHLAHSRKMARKQTVENKLPKQFRLPVACSLNVFAKALARWILSGSCSYQQAILPSFMAFVPPHFTINNRIIEVGSNLWRSTSPNSHSWQNHIWNPIKTTHYDVFWFMADLHW